MPAAVNPDFDAATSPLVRWREAVEMLLCDSDRREELRQFLGRLHEPHARPHSGPQAEAEAREVGAVTEEALADEIFDYLVTLHDTTDWTGTKTPTGFAAPASVHMVTESLKTTGCAISPARAARHVTERLEAGAAFYPGMIGVLARVEDPEVLAAAFFHRPSSHTRSDLGYPWRAMCLRNPHLPSAAADAALVEAATQAGRGRAHADSTVAEGLIDYAHAAAPLADPQITARLILADPERWWHEVARAGVTRSNPQGADFHDRTRDIHTALAALLAQALVDMRTRYAAGETIKVPRATRADPTAPADQTEEDGEVVLASRHPLRERLWWLLKYAQGPGFDTVVETLLAHPDKTVHRKAAAHPQLPLHLVPDLLTHKDVWMRRGAEQVLSRALGEV